MPSKAVRERIKPTVPEAVCHAQGLKKGTPEFERCVEHVTRQALARKRKGARGGKK